VPPAEDFFDKRNADEPLLEKHEESPTSKMPSDLSQIGFVGYHQMLTMKGLF